MQYFDLLTTEELLALAALDLEEDRISKGLIKLKYLVSKEVVSDELDSMLGSIYAKLKLFNIAAEHYSKLLHRTPSRLHERFQLGMVYREMNEIEKAIECWEQVLVEEHNYPPVLFHKALLLMTKNDESEAKIIFEQLVNTADKDNYYVERAQSILEELSILENTESSDVKDIEKVH